MSGQEARSAAQDHVCGPDCQCGCEAGRTIPVRSAAQSPGQGLPDNLSDQAAARGRRRIAWYSACAVMFAAVPAGIVLLRLHELTAGYAAIGIAAALECFFIGWFVGSYSRV